jgi:hypothetical protein
MINVAQQEGEGDGLLALLSEGGADAGHLGA